MVKKIIILLFILILTSCIINPCIWSKISLPKQDYKGKELKINGFYYTEYYTDHYKIVFLYSNGIFIDYSAGYNYNDILNSDTIDFTFNYKKAPIYMYGLFLIKDSIIKIEKWTVGHNCYPYLREGKILNDTTFYLMHREKKEVYHFKQYSPKPDSTNRFIK